MQAAIDSCRLGMLFACLMGGAVLGAQQPADVHEFATLNWLLSMVSFGPT
jgi:hypothetical protein